MIIDIYDVAHGGCAVVTAPNGKKLMLDCGHNSDRPWWPSVHFSGQDIEDLTICNYDEDHVSDLEDLMKNTNLAFITHNTSVSASDLDSLKEESGMGSGITRLKNWMKSVEGKMSTNSPDFGVMKHSWYYNLYPNDFVDENNLSIVTFLEWSDFRIVFSGDLEVAGWRNLLKRPAFVNELRHINVFVASHHGRKTGCCDEVFNICKPQIIVMSDRDKEFDSQNTTDWYKCRCTGIKYGVENKYVFTTRKNGDISITVGPSTWNIATQK